MVRTRADAYNKASTKAPGRKTAPAGARNPNVKTPKSGGGGSGNKYCPRPTPAWQEPITKFFPKNEDDAADKLDVKDAEEGSSSDNAPCCSKDEDPGASTSKEESAQGEDLEELDSEFEDEEDFAEDEYSSEEYDSPDTDEHEEDLIEYEIFKNQLGSKSSEEINNGGEPSKPMDADADDADGDFDDCDWVAMEDDKRANEEEENVKPLNANEHDQKLEKKLIEEPGKTERMDKEEPQVGKESEKKEENISTEMKPGTITELARPILDDEN